MAEMMPQSALVPNSDYIIIGGTGDLALRKIFPALFWRFLDGQVTSSFRLVAAARQESVSGILQSGCDLFVKRRCPMLIQKILILSRS